MRRFRMGCDLPRAAHPSDQLQSLEARMAVAADDDVVVDGDAERGGDVDDRLGHLDVGAGGRRVSRGVVVERPTQFNMILSLQCFLMH